MFSIARTAKIIRHNQNIGQIKDKFLWNTTEEKKNVITHSIAEHEQTLQSLNPFGMLYVVRICDNTIFEKIGLYLCLYVLNCSDPLWMVRCFTPIARLFMICLLLAVFDFFFVGSFTSKSTATMIEPYQIKKNCLDKCKTLCIYHGCVECVGFCCCFLFEHKPIYLALALCVLPNGFTL